jgi:hypothetical protein
MKNKSVRVFEDNFMDCDGNSVTKLDIVINQQALSMGVFASHGSAMRALRRFCLFIGLEYKIVKRGSQ